MEELAGGLMSVAVFCAVVYAIGKAVLAPIHEKLDRILAQQEASHKPKEMADA